MAVRNDCVLRNTSWKLRAGACQRVTRWEWMAVWRLGDESDGAQLQSSAAARSDRRSQISLPKMTSPGNCRCSSAHLVLDHRGIRVACNFALNLDGLLEQVSTIDTATNLNYPGNQRSGYMPQAVSGRQTNSAEVNYTTIPRSRRLALCTDSSSLNIAYRHSSLNKDQARGIVCV